MFSSNLSYFLHKENCKKLINEAKAPLELVCQRFGAKILASFNSSIQENGRAISDNLIDLFEASIFAVENMDDGFKSERLKLSSPLKRRLQAIGVEDTFLEGCVFNYKKQRLF